MSSPCLPISATQIGDDVHSKTPYTTVWNYPHHCNLDRILSIIPLVWQCMGFFTEFYQQMLSLLEKHRAKRILRFMIGTRIVVMFFNADNVEKLLSSSVNIEKANEYDGLHEWLGLGLLTRYLVAMHIFLFAIATLVIWLSRTQNQIQCAVTHWYIPVKSKAVTHPQWAIVWRKTADIWKDCCW